MNPIPKDHAIVETRRRPVEYKCPSQEEMHKFLAGIVDLKHLAMMKVLKDGGIRVSELIAFTYNDFDVNDKKIWIERLKKRGKIKYKDPIFLSDDTHRTMKMYIHQYRPDKTPNKSFFLNTEGEKFTRQGVEFIIDKYAEAAKLQGFVNVGRQKRKRWTPHTFRYYHVTQIAKITGDIKLASSSAGHADIRITESAYTNYTEREGMMRDVVEKL